MPNTLTPSWVLMYNAGTYNQVNAGVAYNASTTATDISAGANTLGQACTFQPDTLMQGTAIRLYANGVFSNTGGTPNLTLGFYWGGVAGVALCATAATASTSGASNNVWQMWATTRVTAVGTAGTALTLGHVIGIGATAVTTTLMPASSATGGAQTIDTSVQKILTVGATWGVNSGSNTITCYQFCVEVLT